MNTYYIIVEGGVVQDILSNEPLNDAKFFLIDLDADVNKKITLTSGTSFDAYVADLGLPQPTTIQKIQDI